MYSSLYDTDCAPKVAFLSSVQDRHILPLKVPKSRLGKMVGLLPAEHPLVGPASYDIEKKTSLFYRMAIHPESLKGYSLGARTAQRQLLQEKFQSPAPNHYWKYPAPQIVKPHKKSVRQIPERSPACSKETWALTPGPGTYGYNVGRNRKVLFQQSFGGNPVHMPQATIKSSIPINTEKLSSSQHERKYHKQLAYLKLYC